MKNALWIRVATLVWLATLAACGHSGSGPATVGVGIGVALSAPSGTTLVQQGATIEIDATVSGDASNAGVTWALSGTAGSTKSSTPTQYIFQANAGIVGAQFVTLTAISVTDPTKFSSVTLTVNGTPTILPPVLFPANVNVAYTSYVSASGGTAPFTWTWTAATGSSTPPGLGLSGSTTAAEAITGTPTTLGTYSFTMTLTDTAGLTASIPLTLIVNAQTACVLNGRFAYLLTGFANGAPLTRAGSINVATDGSVTGMFDLKDGSSAAPATALTSGTCLTYTQNRGQLSMHSAAVDNEAFDFGTVSSLRFGHMQQDDGTPLVEAGQFFQQDPSQFNLAALAGDWVFGAVGDDGGGHRLTVAGRLTLDAAGAISGGLADATGPTPVVAGALTGTLAAPDANGRGTAALSVGSQALPIAYYVIDQNTLFVVSSDAQVTTPRVAGRMTRQSGAGTLDVGAFAQPAILSMWGSSPVNGVASATMTAGRLSGASGGTVGVELDVADRGTQLVNHIYTAQPYAVAASGRATLTVDSGAAARSFVLYADGAGGGYVLEPASSVGNFGILEPQAAGPFTDFSTAYYVGGTMFAGSTSPITLAPQLLFQSGAIGGNLTGNYALDPLTGRMVAAVSRTILGGSDLIVYIVSQQKLVIVGDNLNISNSQLAWFEAY